MIEVIKLGEIPRYKIRCHNCESILSFTREDEIEKFTQDVPFFGMCTDWDIKCPHCGSMIPTRSLTEENYYEWAIK